MKDFIKYFTGLTRNYGVCKINEGYVDPETGKNDGSVRTYGTWTGIHTDSGKEFSLRSYHAMAFKDGKIVSGGDYFDFTGFVNSFE